MAQRAQSSSSLCYTWTYDVFLSFRGADTRTGFTGNLYKALDDKGIHTFLDDEEIRKGEEITPTLLNSIRHSRIAIIIFSKNYAQSSFCLEELVTILDCIKQQNRLVWPIFYDIDPSVVRHLRESYGEALAKHEKRFRHNQGKIHRWKLALHEASNLSGWHFKPWSEYEHKFIGRIVKEVSEKICRIPLHIANYPVGLKHQVQSVISLLNVSSHQEVKMVGIYGIPGKGKTTIARAVYNLIADNFEGVCFLADVRFNSYKYGLTHVQETLLSEIVREKDKKLHDVNRGISMLKWRLQRKKVLIILDNVDKLEQLQAIVGEHDWFGSGSRIIITTRDQHLLNVHGVTLKYEPWLLNHAQALELLQWNAFRSNKVDLSYTGILNSIAHYCDGLPIALEIIGSSLFGKTLYEWYSALESYKRIPNKNVLEILRTSYDALDENEKEVFLDIACFFQGYDFGEVKKILRDGRGFLPQYSLGVLIERCLIRVDIDDSVWMHDLIMDVGREIVRQQSPFEPGKRRRLWFYEDILHVLEENMGSAKNEAIVLHLPEDREVRWNGKALKKMKNLKILIVERANFSTGPKYLPKSLRVLIWKEYPSSSLPSNFSSDKLVMLSLNGSRLILDQPFKNFRSLSEMNLSNCELLERFPDISGVPNLSKLNLNGCSKLIAVHDSVGFLSKLRRMSASGCTQLRIFPNAIKSTFLEYLDMSYCSSLESFPETFGIMEYIEELFLVSNTGHSLVLEDHQTDRGSLLCSSDMMPKIGKLMKRVGGSSNQDQERLNSYLRCLSCHDCFLIDEYLSAWLGFAHDLVSLDISQSNLTDEYLVRGLLLFSNLQALNISESYITVLPECINESHFLTRLYLDRCRKLREIRGIPPNIEILSAQGCTSLFSQSASILLSENLHEGGGTCFTLPGARVPEWFDHSRKVPSLSFWFRNKFPRIALCFVIVEPIFEQRYNGRFMQEPMKRFCVFLNGIEQSILTNKGPDVLPAARHISLFDLQATCVLGDVATFIKDTWNHVEVSLPESYSSSGIGVYLFKHETSSEDVRFTDPNLPKRKFCDLQSRTSC